MPHVVKRLIVNLKCMAGLSIEILMKELNSKVTLSDRSYKT